MTEKAKAKRNEQAEQHARSYDPAGFYKNLPPGIANTKDDFKAGFDAAVAHLSAQAGEWDWKAANEAATEYRLYEKECTCDQPELGTCSYHDENNDFVRGMFKRDAQLSATIGALREENEKLKARVEELMCDLHGENWPDPNEGLMLKIEVENGK